MWIRSELKARGKENFKKSYWKSVLVCLILIFLPFGISGGGITANIETISNSFTGINEEEYYEDIENGYYEDDMTYNDEVFNESFNNFFDGFLIFFAGALIIGIIVGMIIRLFLTYPLIIGSNNFFMNLREGEGSLDSLILLYKSGNLKQNIITVFFIGLYEFLWTLLFIIPGIVKSYEYRMIPYILCENPSINRKRAFEISKEMMKGNKWDTFVLDLSFIGWELLSLITLGIVGIFHVNPYVQSTNAELYAVLREEALKNGYVSENELIGFN